MICQTETKLRLLFERFRARLNGWVRPGGLSRLQKLTWAATLQTLPKEFSMLFYWCHGSLVELSTHPMVLVCPTMITIVGLPQVPGLTGHQRLERIHRWKNLIMIWFPQKSGHLFSEKLPKRVKLVSRKYLRNLFISQPWEGNKAPATHQSNRKAGRLRMVWPTLRPTPGLDHHPQEVGPWDCEEWANLCFHHGVGYSVPLQTFMSFVEHYRRSTYIKIKFKERDVHNLCVCAYIFCISPIWHLKWCSFSFKDNSTLWLPTPTRTTLWPYGWKL